MSLYSFHVSCPECGGNLDHITGGTSVGSEARAVMDCPTCSRSYMVSAYMRMISRDPVKNEQRNRYR